MEALEVSGRAGVSAVVNIRAEVLEHMVADQGQEVGLYHQARSQGPGCEG